MNNLNSLNNKNNININKLNNDTKEIIRENSQMIPSSHPTSVKCEQRIIQNEENKIIVQNYYMTLTNKQYLHFFKKLSEQLTQMNEYQTNNKSIREIVLSKGLEIALEKYGDPLRNLTVPEVAKDLKMGENLTNELFRRKDFPSVNIGKTKTVSALAYTLWKMEHKESEVDA